MNVGCRRLRMRDAMIVELASQKAAILKYVQWREQNIGRPFKTFAMWEKAHGRCGGRKVRFGLHVMENHHFDQFPTYNSSHSSMMGSSRWSGRILISFIPNLQSSFTVGWETSLRLTNPSLNSITVQQIQQKEAQFVKHICRNVQFSANLN